MSNRSMLALLILGLLGCGADFDGHQVPKLSEDQPPASADKWTATNEADSGSQRKMIFTATIDLVVQNFAETETQLLALVSQAGGHVAVFREDRRYGEQLGGHWVIRIPVSQFDGFTAKILELGVPMSRQIDSQDVTEQFVDLTARLKNKRHLEERVLKLLEDRTGAIKDVIEVESQLGRVREEIEVMEGKLRYMSDRVAMTTITISAREERQHVPTLAPTFAANISHTFFSSLDQLRAFCEVLILVAVAVLPWLTGFCIVFAAPTIWLIRRRRRALKSSRPAVEAC